MDLAELKSHISIERICSISQIIHHYRNWWDYAAKNCSHRLGILESHFTSIFGERKNLERLTYVSHFLLRTTRTYLELSLFLYG